MKTSVTLLLFILSFSSFSQPIELKINKATKLPKDSVETKKILKALQAFVGSVNLPNEQVLHVLPTERVETFILLDEMRDMDQLPSTKQAGYYQPQLCNVVKLAEHNYLLQIQYFNSKEDAVQLRALFELVALVQTDSVWFSSPLKRNTAAFKIDSKNGITFHYQQQVNTAKVQSYRKYATMFDQKLGVAGKSTAVFCCNDLPEMQKLVGVLYKSDYNGRAASQWGSKTDSSFVTLFANKNAQFDEFDPHDLFHERLALKKKRSTLCRAVDEGCAYLYGGSWGFSWPEICAAFKKQTADSSFSNWRQLKETPRYFKTGSYLNSIDYVVTALVVEKIEKEKGFEAVWELLNTGPAQKGNVAYYAGLENIIGVKESDYNQFIDQLIKEKGK